MFFQQVGESPDQFAAVRCRHATPGTIFKSSAGGLYRAVNVFAIAFRDRGQHFTGGGIVSLERLARSGIGPLIVDQYLALFGDETCGSVIDSG
jgi:hypothetical protein